MPNPTMSQIQVGESTFDICDLEGRLKLKDLENAISTIQKIIGEQGTAYAIYDSDTNTLTFFRANETYTSSDTSATDIMGNTYTGTIYTGIEDYTTAPAPWNDIKADIEKIVIADNQYIAPKSCAEWFSDTSVEEFENISQLDFRRTTDLSYMFAGCTKLTTLPDLSKWDTSNVANMEHMFEECVAANYKSIAKWDTSNVTNMSNMFNGSNFYSDSEPYLLDWDTSSVTDFSYMFANYEGSSMYKTSKFDTSAAQNMAGMFQNCPNMTRLSIGQNWDTSNVTNMNNMFNNCPELTLDCSSWNVDKVRTHKDFAKDSPDVIEPDWSASLHTEGTAYAVLDSEDTLTFFRSEDNYTAGAGKTVTDVVGNSYTGQVFTGIETYTGTAYYSAPWYTWRSSIKLAKVAENQAIAPKSCGGWFFGCSNMTDFENIEGLDTSNVTNMNNMFSNCSNAAFNPDLSGLDTSNVTAMQSMFSGCSGAAFSPDLSKWNISKVTNISCMFTNCKNATFNPDLSNWDTSSVTNMSQMFWHCYGAAFNPDISNWNTSKVTNMSGMFGDCSGAAFNPDLSDWNTSKVTDMGGMFENCSGAAFNPDLSGLDTSSVTTMQSMFSGCSGAAFNPDLNDWDVSNVTNMNNMFYNCSGAAFNPDLSNWNTSNVTTMESMFEKDSGAAFNFDANNWDTSKVTTMLKMFDHCSGAAFNPDVSNWNTSNVTNMNNMFYNCSGVAFTNLDVSNWNISNVTKMGSMFSNCSNLTTIYAAPDANWGASANLTYSYMMFNGCTKLKGGNGTTYNSSYTDKTYARIDKDGQSGYFTDVARKGNAYAVLDSDGTLTFFRSEDNYTAGTNQTVTDIKGNSYTGQVYTGIETIVITTPPMTPWFFQKSNIKLARIADFQTIAPLACKLWFYYCSNMTAFEGTERLDMSNVTDTNSMFFNCGITNLDVSNWDISSITDMGGMFKNCSNLTTIYTTPNTNWGASAKLTSSSDMFTGCTKLKGGNNTAYNASYTDKTYARIDKAGQPGYFTAKS